MIRVGNIIVNPVHILYVIQEQGNVNQVRVIFNVVDPHTKRLAALIYEGPEAGELWKALDETAGDWRTE